MDDQDSPKEIDLVELLLALWNGKFVILLCTIGSASLSVGYALALPNIYSSYAVLADNPNLGDSRMTGGLSSQIGGIAALAGFNGPAGSVSKRQIALKTITSYDFFKNEIYPKIGVELMAVDSWDMATNSLIYDDEQIQPQSDFSPDGAPVTLNAVSIQAAHAAFLDIFEVADDKNSGFVTISVEHFSPYVAKEWLDMLITSINELMRQRDILKAQDSIKFLQAERGKSNVVSVNSVFSQLIEEQTKAMMLASTSPDYAFQIIQSPYVSEVKARPQRSTIAIAGTFLGGIFGVLAVLIFHYTGFGKLLRRSVKSH